MFDVGTIIYTRINHGLPNGVGVIQGIGPRSRPGYPETYEVLSLPTTGTKGRVRTIEQWSCHSMKQLHDQAMEVLEGIESRIAQAKLAGGELK